MNDCYFLFYLGLATPIPEHSMPASSVTPPVGLMFKSRSSKAQRSLKQPITGASKIPSFSNSGGLSGLDLNGPLSTLPLTILPEEIYSVQLPLSQLPSVTSSNDHEKGMCTTSSSTSESASSRLQDLSLGICESPESEEENDSLLEPELVIIAKPERQCAPLQRKFSMHHMSEIFREIVQHRPLSTPFVIPEKEIEDEEYAEILVKDKDKEQKKNRSMSRKNSIVDEPSSPGSNTPGLSPSSPRVLTRKDSKVKAILPAGKCEKESIEEM